MQHDILKVRKITKRENEPLQAALTYVYCNTSYNVLMQNQQNQTDLYIKTKYIIIIK